MIDRELSGLVLDSVFEVHRELGPGLLELPYRNALFYSLRSRGLRVEMERGFTVDFRGERVGEYFADLVVEGRIIFRG
jgi:GxxExxY protein